MSEASAVPTEPLPLPEYVYSKLVRQIKSFILLVPGSLPAGTSLPLFSLCAEF